MDKLFVNFLPPWVETNIQPAFYDKESGSVLQQTARMYAKVNCLVRMFNKLSKETKETVDEYIAKFVELKDFVDTYFENLDVQEEINNKLDQMGEDGELAHLLNLIPMGNPNFSILQRVSFDTTQLYNGHSHASMQGFCYAKGNLIGCFRNHNDEDNYVRLVEINPANGSIIRQSYLELNHANAISYSEKDNKFYVASCAKMVDGVYTNDDVIFTVDNTSLQIIDTINVSNIPDGHRIRSVWYDNETNTLYGGDEFELFIIDEASETIVDTIELDTTYIDTSALNQTLKKVGNYYIGVYVSFIAYWDLKGQLVKIEQIDTIQNNEYIGELEDIAFDNDNNLIIGSINYDSPRLHYRNASFYISNNIYNKSSNVRIFGASTTSYSIYVDGGSVASKEDGSESYPFKSLQRAVNYIMYAKKNIELVIKEGNYPYLYVHGIENLSVNIAGNATIDGLEILDSSVIIFRTGSQTLAINGVSVRNSTFRTDFDITYNKFNRNDVFGSDYNLYVYNSKAVITNGTFVGDNDHTLARIQKSSEASFVGSNFSDYAGYFAIEASSDSVVHTFDLTLDKVVSDTEHNFRVAEGSRFYTRNDLNAYENWVIESQGMKYPSESIITPSHTFFGELCTVDYHYNYVQLRVKLAGANSDHKDILIKIADLNSYVIDTTAMVTTGITYGKLELNYNDTTHVLSIYKSSSCWHNFADGTDTYTTNDTDSPTNQNKWAKIEKITFLSL